MMDAMGEHMMKNMELLEKGLPMHEPDPELEGTAFHAMTENSIAKVRDAVIRWAKVRIIRTN